MRCTEHRRSTHGFKLFDTDCTVLLIRLYSLNLKPNNTVTLGEDGKYLEKMYKIIYVYIVIKPIILND